MTDERMIGYNSDLDLKWLTQLVFCWVLVLLLVSIDVCLPTLHAVIVLQVFIV